MSLILSIRGPDGRANSCSVLFPLRQSISLSSSCSTAFFVFLFFWGSDCAQGDDVSCHYEDVAMVHQEVSLQGADVMRDEHHEPELTWAPSHLTSYTSHL